MAIPLLNLDDRTFQDMMAEIEALIPRYAPAWTNRNLSDPGMTLLELFTWVTEAMLFRINRVPEASRQRFLELLGAVYQPAQPAVIKVLVAAAVHPKQHITLPRHTPVLVYPDLRGDAILCETVDTTLFTGDLPTRTVLLRQTTPATTTLTSDGQAFLLARLPAPVTLPIAPASLPPQLWVGAGDDVEFWEYVPTLRASGPDSRHFTIHARSNAVLLGDGRRGAIPPAGAPLTFVDRSVEDGLGLLRRQLLRPGEGTPNQVLRLAEAPSARDLQPISDLTPRVTVAGRHWAFCPTLYEFVPDGPQFTVAPWANALRFGNGARGKRPQAAAAITVHYRTTTGPLPQLPAATTFVFDCADAGAFSVLTFQVVDPGVAATSNDAARDQAFALIKPRWRGVTTEDFAAVLRSEQQDIHRVQCLPGATLTGDAQHAAAAIGVLVTPRPRAGLAGAAAVLGAPLRLAPAGRSLVTATPDGHRWLWNLQTGARSAEVATAAERDLAFSATGDRLVVVANDGRTTLYDGQRGGVCLPATGAAPLITSLSLLAPADRGWFTVRVAADGAFVAAELRAVDDGVVYARLPVTTPVTHALFTPDGRRLVTVQAAAVRRGGRSTVRLWDTASGEAIATIIETDAAIEQLLVGPGGQAVAAVRAGGEIMVWNSAKRTPHLLVKAGAAPKLASINAAATRLATVSHAGVACLWSLQTGELIALLESPHAVAGIQFSPDDRWLITYDAAGALRVWQAREGSLALSLDAGAPLAALAMDRAAQRLAVVTTAPGVLVWDLVHAGAPLLALHGAAMITSATLSAQGDWVAWSTDNLVTVWEVATGRSAATLQHSRTGVGVQLAWPAASAGLLLTVMESGAAGDGQRRLQLWNAACVQEVAEVLAARHLIASEPHVQGPAFIDIGLQATLVRHLPPQQERAALAQAVARALLAFFDPLTGGPDGGGWPLGRAVFPSEVYQVMEQTPGIDHVESLCLFIGGEAVAGAPRRCVDVVPIPPHYLVNCVLDAGSIRIIDPERAPFAVTT